MVLILLLLGGFCSDKAVAQTSDQCLHIGERLFDQKHYPECIKALDRGIELNPKDAKLYYGRSLALSKLERCQEASTDLLKAMNLDPKNRKYCEQLIQWGDFLNKPPQIIEGWKRIYAISPNDPEPLVKIAELYRATGDRDREQSADEVAIATISKMKQTKDTGDQLAALYRSHGQVRAIKNDHQTAVADYTKALKYQPDDAPTLNNRSTAYAALGQPQKAIDDLTHCIKVEPKNEGNLERRARLYIALKDYPKALEDVNRAIPLEHISSAALVLRAQIYTAMGKNDLAEKDRKAIAARNLEYKPTKFFDTPKMGEYSKVTRPPKYH